MELSLSRTFPGAKMTWIFRSLGRKCHETFAFSYQKCNFSFQLLKNYTIHKWPNNFIAQTLTGDTNHAHSRTQFRGSTVLILRFTTAQFTLPTAETVHNCTLKMP